ncbi:MAG: hypothetical protein QXU96_08320 [Ignisphaera sp.]
MSIQNCVKSVIKNVWYDTVDQPVIPIDFTNECPEDVYITIDIKALDRRILHREKIKLKPSERNLSR